jgi:hypothetical protein
MIVHDYTLMANSQIRSHRIHDTTALVGPAVDVFTRMFANGQHFCKPIPQVEFEHIELLWTEQNGNAMATFKSRRKPATTSILFSGKNREEESGFLSEVDEMLGVWGMPPAGLTIVERPLLVSIPWPILDIPTDDLRGIADMETCLAAAFFERLAE